MSSEFLCKQRTQEVQVIPGRRTCVFLEELDQLELSLTPDHGLHSPLNSHRLSSILNLYRNTTEQE